jgi:hypothetical protein
MQLVTPPYVYRRGFFKILSYLWYVIPWSSLFSKENVTGVLYLSKLPPSFTPSLLPSRLLYHLLYQVVYQVV